MKPLGRPPRRGLAAAVSAVAAAAVVASMLAIPASPASAEPVDTSAVDKIEPALARKLAEVGGEPQDFWVSFTESADASAAADIDDWAERGQFVVDRLQETAEAAQAETIRTLEAAGVAYTSYWITNAIRVEGGTHGLALSLATGAGVERLFSPVSYRPPEPVEIADSEAQLEVNAEGEVEWGLANIQADQVWDRYGVRGDGIVVANIDTGVEYDHPALIASYRGNEGNGVINNDYNWFDVTGNAPSPADNNGHGTHTMGTMVGDDGAANRTGAAPGVTWIAANGCATCTGEDLAASAQWMLAPTRSDGSGRDPAMRPHIINNSWGTELPTNDPLLEDIQLAWMDSGIFAAWSNGNSGPDCQTSGSPGSRIISYSTGAYDESNTIAEFSARGDGQDGEVKPNISAPGVAVRSAYLNNQYALGNGTSMAAPHVAGAVALLWAADPTLVGDLATTRQLLDDTATDTADDQCGGTADDNNVYGEGRLNALGLVEAADLGELGTLTGAVTDVETGDPIAGAAIRLAAGDIVRSVRSAGDGSFGAGIPAGAYSGTATVFGYEPAPVDVVVAAGEVTTRDIALVPQPGHTVTGQVVDELTGAGVPDATVTVAGSRFAATTDAAGNFQLAGVPGPRSYRLSIDAGICGDQVLYRSVEVNADVALPTIEMPRRRLNGDENRVYPYNTRSGQPPYGYSCVVEPSNWVDGDTLLVDNPAHPNRTDVELPFEFRYFGVPTDLIQIDQADPTIRFVAPSGRAGIDNDSDLRLVVDRSLSPLDENAKIYTRASGESPNRTFTIEWRNYGYHPDPGRLSLAVTLHEAGDIIVATNGVDLGSPGQRSGSYMVMWALGPGGPARWACCMRDYIQPNVGTPFAWRSDTTQLRIDLPDAGLVSGTVTDARSGAPVPGATVDVVDRFGRVIWRRQTDPDGRYRAEIFTGQQYQISASKPGGYPAVVSTTARVPAAGATAAADLQLRSANPRIRPGSLDLTAGRPASLQIGNRGSEPYQWEVSLRLPDPDAPPAGTETGVRRMMPASQLALAVAEAGSARWELAVGSTAPGAHPYRLLEFALTGEPTGNEIPIADLEAQLDLPSQALKPLDLAYIEALGQLCVTGGQGDRSDLLVCVQSSTGTVMSVIELDVPRGHLSHGLAYDDLEDRFFVQHGTTEQQTIGNRIVTVAGVRHGDPGQLLNSCTMYGVAGPGLAYQPASGTLWKTTNDYAGVSQVDPATCVELGWRQVTTSLRGGLIGTGTDIRADGTLLAAGNFLGHLVQEIATGDHLTPDVPWLELSQTSGTQAGGRPTTVTLTLDPAQLPDGLSRADLLLRGNSGAQDPIVVPLILAEQ